MRNTWRRKWAVICGVVAVMAGVCTGPAGAADSLVWHKNKDQDRVDADIQGTDLFKFLENLAAVTGWHIYVEPDANRKVSAKFKDLPEGQALHALLGNLNFAVFPQTNGPSRLYVFHTSAAQATQLVRSAPRKAAKPIPNELIVTLKPGSKTKIDELAKALGARVVGRMDGENAYRLQFDSEDAANAARLQLADNPDVQAVDSNFAVNGPPDVRTAQGTSTPNLQLDPKANSGDCQLVIGLIDTPVQSLGKNLDSFILPSISVAGGNSIDPSQVTHGTAMADTMLETLQKATKGGTSVKIQPVDVYGNNPTTTTFDVANGLVTAVNKGANVINMSLGSDGDSQFLHNMITQVSQRGIPIFAAAGNEPVTTPTYPAAYPEVQAVTASDASGHLASYANRGSFVDMMAPGDSVINYDNKAFFVQGTSSATAYASALAAGLADNAHDCADQALTLLKSNFKTTSTPGTAVQK